ncbi:MAG: DUF4468 domain-containing protein [Parabacteroides sp.]|nr:DUF4468 domain-containing protein [Parabacteroides sp.]
MKKLLLFVLFIPSFLSAQTAQKYLVDAVPVEDGKVVFTREIIAPSFSKDAIYDKIIQWANTFFNGEINRVVYSDKALGEITALGDTTLIFKHTALSLDKTQMNYRTKIKCENEKCTITTTGIRYEYDDSDEKQKYIAEEWITDKYCLNKAKTKLYPITGKFRVKTIDFIDEMALSASASFGMQTAIPAGSTQTNNNQIIATPQTPTATVATTTPTMVSPATTIKREGYVAFAADKVPSTILQLLSESDMQIALTSKEDTKDASATWKGSGNIFGKPTVSISIPSDNIIYKGIDNNNGAISLFFFKKENSQEAWLIIDCHKQGETIENNQITIIGEIINVWMK